VDRASALAYLTSEFAELATDAKFSSTQTSTAYNTAIENSLRKLGVVEEDLATADVVQADIQKYLKLLEYFALKRFSRVLSIRFDAEVGQKAVVATRSQAFKMVEQLIEEARSELAVLGIVVGGDNNIFEMGRINLDFLEPSKLGEF
jgi:hypothetical protein